MGQSCESKGNTKNPETKNEQVLNQCKLTKDKLDKYILVLEHKEKVSREKARECLRNKQRDRAKFYLKGCKAYQQRIKLTQAKSDMIDDQIMNIENAQTGRDTIEALRKGNEALTELHKEVKMEDLENIKDDFESLKDNDREIAEFWKEKTDENEAECEDEFEQLVKEVQSEKVNNGGNIADNNINLPKTPINETNAGVTNNKIENANINNNQQIAMNQKL